MPSVAKLGNFVSLQVPVTKTATFNSTGVEVDEYINGLEIHLHSAAGTGTSPTMDVKIQDSADNSTFADITGATFTQVTDAATASEAIEINVDSAARYIRAVATIGGTTPSFIYSIVAFGQKQVAG